MLVLLQVVANITYKNSSSRISVIKLSNKEIHEKLTGCLFRDNERP
jgi:hypothetical protein